MSGAIPQIPQSSYYKVTQVNGKPAFVLHDNSFRYLLVNNFDILNKTVIHDDDTDAVKREKNKVMIPVDAFIEMFVKAAADAYAHGGLISVLHMVDLTQRTSDTSLNYINYDEIDTLEESLEDDKVSTEDKVKNSAQLEVYYKERSNLRLAFITLANYCIEIAYINLVALLAKFDKDEPLSFMELFTIAREKRGSPLAIEIKDGHKVISNLQRATLESSAFTGPYIQLTYTAYYHDGTSFNAKQVQSAIDGYDDLMQPSQAGLSIPTQELKDKLIARANLYIKYTGNGPYYARNTGVIIQDRGWFIAKFNGTGRVMIDTTGMRVSMPNYSKYWPQGSMHNQDNGSSNRSKGKHAHELSNTHKYALTPFIYGFSFVSKVWGELVVENIGEISFRNDAYDKLVLDSDTKGLVRALVDNTIGGAEKDFIDNKGGGCIFLLEGVPGTGKTLTAESVAETLQRPLYLVGVGELGTNVVELEENLKRVLDIASAWNAVLLLDEADIFMEQRSEMDVERNAMVSIFLRLLEYYQGIMFLTTNRADNIDQAFYSRISLAINYPDLNVQSRSIIWTNILSLYSKEFDTSTVDIAILANHDINGRQIKNACRIVSALARYHKREPRMSDYIMILDRMGKFVKPSGTVKALPLAA